MTHFHLLVLSFFLTWLSISQRGCTLGQSPSSENIAALYLPRNQVFHPEFLLHHFSDDSTRIYYRIKASEFLATGNDTSLRKIGWRLSWRIFSVKDNFRMTDSSGISRSDSSASFASKIIEESVSIKLDTGKTYLIEFRITDRNRNFSSKFFAEADKSGPDGGQFYLPESGSGLLYSNWINDERSLSLRYKSLKSPALFVKRFSVASDLPPPPYSLSDRPRPVYTPDSIFSISEGSKNLEEHLRPGSFCFFQVDTNKIKGLTLFRYGNDYPRVTDPARMLEPLRYLCSRKEYEELRSIPNEKDAVDKYWLNVGGNYARSKELIRKFYNRVQEANRLFASVSEGWKTDRGLIYIVFGSPNVVTRSQDSENWMYGSSGSMNSLSFSFQKIPNPYSSNDYVLNRSQIYEQPWFRAVELWRQGRVFNE